jgi:hypothetical protein
VFVDKFSVVFTGMALANSMIIASNSNVKPLPGLAQGTSTKWTPHLSQSILGTLAVK